MSAISMFYASREVAPATFRTLVRDVPPIVMDERGRFWLCKGRSVYRPFLGLEGGRDRHMLMLVPVFGPCLTMEEFNDHI